LLFAGVTGNGVSVVSNEVGVSPEQLDKVASALESLRDVLAANVPVIVNTLGSYGNGGTGQSVSLKPLKQAQARSPGDAADMRARSNLAQAWMDNPANIDVVAGGVAYIPWDTASVNSQDATLDAQKLADAEKSGNLAEIQAVEQDIKDHLAEGAAGLPFLSAFYNDAGPAVAGLAGSLYAEGGSDFKQPLTAQDQQILNVYASGLAYVLKNGSGQTALSAQTLNALENAPDMWSMAMLVKYGPPAAAYGNGAGLQLLQAVGNATVQISPHVIVAANDPRVPELRAAWAWASKRHIIGASTAGDVEFSRWVEIATVSPYKDLFHGELSSEFAGMEPDFRIEGTFNQGGKVLLSSAGLGAVVFLADPKSLLGAKPEDLQKLIPDSYTGPKPLKTGAGWKFNELKTGTMIAYEEGNPSGANLGQADSVLHQGPYYKISENGYVYRIAAEGNPALNDPNAATISITAPDGSKTYIYENLPIDDTADGDGEGGELDAGGEGADGGGGAPDG
jgi:hypothetical protein